MSRIGRAPIAIPAGVTFDNTDNLITVKGPLGTLTQKVDKSIDVAVEDGHIVCKRHSDDKDHRALHGLYRALIHNMVVGVTKGFEKSLIVAGVGFKITLTGNKQPVSVTIKPEAVDPDDVEMLEDMVLAALNDACKQADELSKEILGPLGGAAGLL